MSKIRASCSPSETTESGERICRKKLRRVWAPDIDQCVYSVVRKKLQQGRVRARGSTVREREEGERIAERNIFFFLQAKSCFTLPFNMGPGSAHSCWGQFTCVFFFPPIVLTGFDFAAIVPLIRHSMLTWDCLAFSSSVSHVIDRLCQPKRHSHFQTALKRTCLHLVFS